MECRAEGVQSAEQIECRMQSAELRILVGEGALDIPKQTITAKQPISLSS